jgi:signal transduction histidine kinase
MSRIETGQTEISVTEVNINEQIENIYDLFNNEAERKKLKFSYKNPLPDKEVCIRSDANKINSILINLVKNAIKFTREGSIEMGYEMKGQYLEFFITDTGR